MDAAPGEEAYGEVTYGEALYGDMDCCEGSEWRLIMGGFGMCCRC